MCTWKPTEEALLEAAAELLRLLDADSVYLFGSAVTGKMTRESDIDLAVLASRRLDPVAVFEARGRMSDMVGMPIDLVSLREASPIVAMQVIRKGRLLIDRDRPGTARFVMTLPSRYEDLRLSRKPIEDALLKRTIHAGR